ncbi:hypothetical protein Aspvir_007506 [Aspergillus viridinutans]|uniref:Uncharacterized protein n=1 Tax=Aspergillus viridinutans TaxID=75553 RepID=A0A9P3C0T1_ASPVI|nr:uncharacterized protein Aspvir_007506 [Aspergillus viridinutans]GIK03437.1 hypothetical protein Aspvir_007506 [Aspergillus viridinutans]
MPADLAAGDAAGDSTVKNTTFYHPVAAVVGRSRLETDQYDFTISGAGLRCQFLTPLSLSLVNKQVRQEVLSIIFQNATACVHVQIPTYGPFSDVAASVPRIIHTLDTYPQLLGLAQDIVIIIDAEQPYSHALFRKLDSGLWALVRNDTLRLLTTISLAVPAVGFLHAAGWAHRTGPFHRDRDAAIHALIDTILRGVESHKQLKIILHLDNLYLRDLKIMLRLLQMPASTVTLEEWWLYWSISDEPEKARDDYEATYKHFVQKAAEESGQTRLLTVCPLSDTFEIDETDDGDTRGIKYIRKRRRVWVPPPRG